jgi:hypothetical protein
VPNYLVSRPSTYSSIPALVPPSPSGDRSFLNSHSFTTWNDPTISPTLGDATGASNAPTCPYAVSSFLLFWCFFDFPHLFPSYSHSFTTWNDPTISPTIDDAAGASEMSTRPYALTLWVFFGFSMFFQLFRSCSHSIARCNDTTVSPTIDDAAGVLNAPTCTYMASSFYFFNVFFLLSLHFSVL